MKVASYNISSGGFNSYNYESPEPERLNLLRKAISVINADFTGLVDTFRWDGLYRNDQIAQIFEYKNAYCINLNDERLRQKGHNNGITVLTNLLVKSFETISLGTRDAIKTSIMEKNNIFDVFTVYLDDLSEDTRIAQIKALLKQVNQDKPTIIMGDLNTLDTTEAIKVNSLIDKFFAKQPQSYENIKPALKELKRAEVTKILGENMFIDADKIGIPTWPSKLFSIKTDNPFLRLDYAFHTKNIQTSNINILRDSFFDKVSDHYPIVFDVDIEVKSQL